MKAILSNMIPFLAYFVGAIPTGAWMVQYYAARDITQYGSGNIGATNVGRLFGARGFIAVFLIDCLKAYFFLLGLSLFDVSEYSMYFAAIGLLIGNSYSFFLQGRGGKGVATSLGIMLAHAPVLCLFSFIVWLLFFRFTKIVGIASVLSYSCLPFVAYPLYSHSPIMRLVMFVAVWGIFRHQENIKKYLEKNEI